MGQFCPQNVCQYGSHRAPRAQKPPRSMPKGRTGCIYLLLFSFFFLPNLRGRGRVGTKARAKVVNTKTPPTFLVRFLVVATDGVGLEPKLGAKIGPQLGWDRDSGQAYTLAGSEDQVESWRYLRGSWWRFWHYSGARLVKNVSTHSRQSGYVESLGCVLGCFPVTLIDSAQRRRSKVSARPICAQFVGSTLEGGQGGGSQKRVFHKFNLPPTR